MIVKSLPFSVTVGEHEVQGTARTPAQPWGNIIVQGAIGAEQRHYRKFAAHMALLGLRVITYDYSGTGASRRVPARRCSRRPTLWGKEDQAEILAWTRRTLPNTPVCIMGHSVGGQVIGFSASVADADAIILVAGQDPHLEHWKNPAMRLQARARWALIFSASRTLGFVPGRLYGGYRLSAAIAKEGVAWATSKRRLLVQSGVPANLSLIRAPVLSYSFSDDPFAPRESVDALVAACANAEVERLHIEPSAVGLERIGHFGFFSARSSPLWDDLGRRLSTLISPSNRDGQPQMPLT